MQRRGFARRPCGDEEWAIGIRRVTGPYYRLTQLWLGRAVWQREERR